MACNKMSAKAKRGSLPRSVFASLLVVLSLNTAEVMAAGSPS